MRTAIAAAMLCSAAPVLAQAGEPVSGPAAVALLGPALNVSSRDRAVEFYTKGLGMVVQMEMGPANRRETMLGFASFPGQPAIILLSDQTAKSPPAYTQGTAFNRLVMRVRDIDGVVARLRSLGHKASDVKNVAQGYRMAMTTDPDGYKLELVEAPPRKETK